MTFPFWDGPKFSWVFPCVFGRFCFPASNGLLRFRTLRLESFLRARLPHGCARWIRGFYLINRAATNCERYMSIVVVKLSQLCDLKLLIWRLRSPLSTNTFDMVIKPFFLYQQSKMIIPLMTLFLTYSLISYKITSLSVDDMIISSLRTH